MTGEPSLEKLESRLDALESSVRVTERTVYDITKSLVLLGELVGSDEMPLREPVSSNANRLSDQDLWKLDVERRLASIQSAVQELSAVVYKRRD